MQTPPAAGDVNLDRLVRLVSASFLPREITVVKFVFDECFMGKYADVTQCRPSSDFFPRPQHPLAIPAATVMGTYSSHSFYID